MAQECNHSLKRRFYDCIARDRFQLKPCYGQNDLCADLPKDKITSQTRALCSISATNQPHGHSCSDCTLSVERIGPYITTGGNVWTTIYWKRVLELAAAIKKHRKLFITSVFVGAVDEAGA